MLTHCALCTVNVHVHVVLLNAMCSEKVIDDLKLDRSWIGLILMKGNIHVLCFSPETV